MMIDAEKGITQQVVSEPFLSVLKTWMLIALMFGGFPAVHPIYNYQFPDSATRVSNGKLCNCVIVKTLYSLLLTVTSKFRLSLHPYVY